jgi:hypothetical protein
VAEEPTRDRAKPVVGQDVYIASSLHLTHGEDDFAGGLCRVVRIDEETSPGLIYVEVEEDPGTLHNWAYLLEHQDQWRGRYGARRGHPDPDYRPEFNEPEEAER